VHAHSANDHACYVYMWAVSGGEPLEDARETPRSPTMAASGNAVVGERSSTSSDSATVSSSASTDHNVNDRHSTDELTSKFVVFFRVHCHNHRYICSRIK